MSIQERGNRRIYLSEDSGSHPHAVSYGSLYLSVTGTYAMAPILSTWIANNSEPHYRRATSVAMGFIATNAVSDVHFNPGIRDADALPW